MLAIATTAAMLLAAASKLQAVQPVVERPNVLAGAFPAQLAFIQDPAPFKASFCTRRAAKSFSVGLEFIDDSLDFPRAHYLFLMKVRAQAKRDFWEDVLKAIDRQYQLGIVFNESELIATLPNKAKIYVGGADSSSNEWQKMIAGKYRKVHVDEAQAFVHADLKNLVYEAFKPAVADYRGSIGLSGTPGFLRTGLFHDVVKGEEQGWSVHRWSWSDNPHTNKQIKAEIAELKELKPGVELTPWFRRNYKAEWVIEATNLVYRYEPGRNDFKELPTYPSGAWHFVNGTDLGYNDPTSWVKVAYHDHDPCLYILRARKEAGLDVTAVAVQTKAEIATCEYDALVIDNANKQAVEEMRRRHDIPWKPADKTGKADFIEIMNGEFIVGRIKLKEGPECDPLREEYANLIWDDKKMEKGKREEHAACENHCTDGGLYAWRWCYAYLSERLVPKPIYGSPEWAKAEEQAMEDFALEQAKQEAMEAEWS